MGAQAMAASAGGNAAQRVSGNDEPRTVWAVPCDCTAEDRGERSFVRARIPERYRHCDFDNYERTRELKAFRASSLRFGTGAWRLRS